MKSQAAKIVTGRDIVLKAPAVRASGNRSNLIQKAPVDRSKASASVRADGHGVRARPKDRECGAQRPEAQRETQGGGRAAAQTDPLPPCACTCHSVLCRVVPARASDDLADCRDDEIRLVELDPM